VVVELPCRFALKNDSQNSTTRHCEGRRPVAIQTTFQFALAFQIAEPPSGLPRRFAPRNDEAEGFVPAFGRKPLQPAQAFKPWSFLMKNGGNHAF
jgi:hypothetical protein